MGAAQAADLRVVTLLVPYPAGGLSDSIARAISAALGRALNQQVIVDNLGGVSGSLAAQKVLNAPADGHMIFLGSPNEVILSPMVNAAVKLRAEDFRMLGQVAVNPLVLLTRSTLPVRNVDEFIAYAKTQDKGLSYGSVGMGSMYHLLLKAWRSRPRSTSRMCPTRAWHPWCRMSEETASTLPSCPMQRASRECPSRGA
jgi:tripartite-type tricarboxylate transporter receptor subunit TctC